MRYNCSVLIPLGYIVISGALSPITQEFGLTTVQQELVVGAGTFGAIFGGFFAGLVKYRKCNTWIYK